MTPLDRIIKNIPLKFFTDVMDETNGAWAKAYKETQNLYEAPERPNMLGQNRHAFSESAFREAAIASDLYCEIPHTEPAGGRYSLISTNNVYLIRSNIQAHCGIPKPTAFRKSWASLNEWLDPTQSDLLKEVKKPDVSRLCAMLIATHGRKDSDQTVPAFLGIGVPNNAFSRWKIIKPIEYIIRQYHDFDITVRKDHEAEINIKDIAVPRLKRRK